MKRWTWKQSVVLVVFVLFVGVMIFNIVRNNGSGSSEANGEQPSSAAQSPSTLPTVDQDEIDLLIEEQGESGEPETGPGELPVGEKWFDAWRPTAEQLAMAFVDTGQTQEEWMEGLSDMMTDRLAESYEGVDLRNVPRGTYQRVVLDETSSTWSSVWVTIEYDSFSMKVRLKHQNDRWLAETIEPS